jgi:hypothetical protein
MPDETFYPSPDGNMGAGFPGRLRLALEMSRNPKTSAAEIFEKLPSSRQKMSSAAAD